MTATPGTCCQHRRSRNGTGLAASRRMTGYTPGTGEVTMTCPAWLAWENTAGAAPFPERAAAPASAAAILPVNRRGGPGGTAA
jgi:hypothetical protein